MTDETEMEAALRVNRACAEEVRVLCSRLGYGFVMHEASRLWRLISPGGAHVVGPAAAFVVTCNCTSPRACAKCHGCGWVFAEDGQ